MAEQHNPRSRWATRALLGGGLAVGGAALAFYLRPDLPEAPELRKQAAAYEQRGEYGAAIISLKNAIEAQPKDALTRFQLARVYLESGESEAAEKEIRSALRLGYSAEAALPVLAESLLLQAQFQKALDETDSAAAAGHNPELLTARADALRGLGRLDDARPVYEAVLAAAPRTVSAMVGLGRLALRSGRADEASALGARALAAAPGNTTALLFQADLLRSSGRYAEALGIYDQVLAINPGHRSAYIHKADLAITLRQFDAAQRHLDAARKLTPNSIQLAYTQALLYFSQGQSEQARNAVHLVLRAVPDHMPSVLLAGAISMNLNSLHQAESHLRHFLQSNPDNAYARKMLAATLLRSGHTQDAMNVLTPALEAADGDVQLMALAGEANLQARSFGKAAELFQQASALAPEAAELRTSLGLSKLGKGELNEALDDLRAATKLDRGAVEAGVALVRTELSLQRHERALAAVEELARVQPRSAIVADLKGSVQVALGKPGAAREQFARALALQPDYYPAAAHLAELELKDGKFAEARVHLNAFLDKNKGHAEALTAMATVADRDGKPQEATQWLERAAASAADLLGPSVNLIGQYLRTGQTQKALDLASKLQVSHPGNPDLLDLVGKGRLANGQMEAALSAYKELAIALPRSAQARMQVAALELQLKQEVAAEHSLKDVLAIAPDFPAAQLALAELYVRKGHHELALVSARRIQRFHPDASAGFQLEGDIQMARQQAAPALEAYRRAYALTPNAELTIKISHALRQTGKPDQAAARLAQWLSAHPDDVRVQLYRADVLMREQRHAQAAAQLEAILARHPGQAVALNNLALAYQRMNDPRARPIAEKAYALAAGQAGVMDTLGWILVEQGELARGLSLLRDAHARAPRAPDIRYHLAVAMARAKDTDGARKLLEGLVAEKGRFADSESARRLLGELR